METIDHDALVAMLNRLKLTAIRDQLDTLLEEAARSDMSLREALGFLVSREIASRDQGRIEMATKLAQFPFVRELETSNGPHSLRWLAPDPRAGDLSLGCPRRCAAVPGVARHRHDASKSVALNRPHSR